MQRTLVAIRAALGVTGATVILSGAGCADSRRAADDVPTDGSDDGATAMDDGATVMDMDARVQDDARVPMMQHDGALNDDARVPFDGSIVLAAFPLDELVCTGPNHDEDDGGPGGYWGQCCAQVRCYQPDAGADCETVEQVRNDRFYFGSGECNCGAIHGPYARPEDAGTAAAGDCCYAVPIIGCTGRPLSTDCGHLLAPVVISAEWLA